MNAGPIGHALLCYGLMTVGAPRCARRRELSIGVFFVERIFKDILLDDDGRSR